MRLGAGEIPSGLVCEFRFEGSALGPLEVLDLSATGFAASAPPHLALAPGSVLEGLELRSGGRVLWLGDAVVVHSGAERLGGRFTSGVLDLHHVRLHVTLEERLAVHREQRQLLPVAWRAAVADLRQLLEDVRAEVEQIERSEAHDPMRRGEEEAELFDALIAGWGGEFYAAVVNLHEMSRELDARANVLGRAYAASMIAPLLNPCPVFRRAYEKPLGYAGDYRTMELLQTNEMAGEGLYGRFLLSVAQDCTFGRTVRARGEVLRRAVRDVLERPGHAPLKVLALAAGPAIELRRLLEEMDTLGRPAELILLDQDPSAQEVAHRQLTRILLERHRGILPVTVRGLHVSVSQLLMPRTREEQQVRDDLNSLDLVYSAGLYDYLPDSIAHRLTRFLYGRLSPGGRLLVGNMKEAPDSTWLMDFVAGWPLLYRTEATMLPLADWLSPSPQRLAITPDETGHCIFLDVTKP